jgi:nucleotide-binding universal stress UspA family protein
MIAVVIAAVLAALLAAVILRRAGRPTRRAPSGPERILFPFVGSALSRRALDAALRLARAEEATLVPVFLARVPLHLPLDAPLPRQAGIALPLQEAIEQRAAAFAVAVDARIERGRTSRHALRQTITNERFDRIVMAAAVEGGHGFGPADIAWLLEHALGEIVILRPGTEDPILRMPDPRHPRRPRRARPPGPAGAGTPRPVRAMLGGARGPRGMTVISRRTRL